MPLSSMNSTSTIILAPNPSNLPLNRPPITPTPSQAHPICLTRSSAPHPQSPSSMSKHKSPDEDGALEEDLRHMEADALRHCFDALRAIHSTHSLAATPFSHLHHARHPRSKRIEQCVVRSRIHSGCPKGY